MASRLLLVCLFLLISGPLAQADVVARPVYIDRIAVGPSVEVFASVGETYSLTARARRGTVSSLRVTEDDGQLSVSLMNSANAVSRIEVFVTVPGLTAVAVRGGGQLSISELEREAFEARIETGGILNVRRAQVEAISLLARTGGVIRIDGTCTRLIARATTGAQLKADHLKCRSVDGHADRGAVQRVFSSETAELTAQTGATLVHSGGAQEVTELVETWATLRRW